MDIKARRGEFKGIVSLPVHLGYEIAGEISEIGSEVKSLSIGEAVFGRQPSLRIASLSTFSAAISSLDNNFGGCAEFSVQPAINVLSFEKHKASLTFEEVSAGLLPALKAYTALHYQLRLV